MTQFRLKSGERGQSPQQFRLKSGFQRGNTPLLNKQNEKEYLQITKAIAEEAGYNPDDLSLANDMVHKLSLNGIKFGNVKYPDFVLLMMNGDKEEARKHRKNYLTRTAGMRGNWRKNVLSKNNLARRIIWFEDA